MSQCCRKQDEAKAEGDQPKTTVQVRISRNFNDYPVAWWWSVEVTKGSKVYSVKGSAESRVVAETLAEEHTSQILNPTTEGL